MVSKLNSKEKIILRQLINKVKNFIDTFDTSIYLSSNMQNYKKEIIFFLNKVTLHLQRDEVLNEEYIFLCQKVLLINSLCEEFQLVDLKYLNETESNFQNLLEKILNFIKNNNDKLEYSKPFVNIKGNDKAYLVNDEKLQGIAHQVFANSFVKKNIQILSNDKNNRIVVNAHQKKVAPKISKLERFNDLCNSVFKEQIYKEIKDRNIELLGKIGVSNLIDSIKKNKNINSLVNIEDWLNAVNKIEHDTLKKLTKETQSNIDEINYDKNSKKEEKQSDKKSTIKVNEFSVNDKIFDEISKTYTQYGTRDFEVRELKKFYESNRGAYFYLPWTSRMIFGPDNEPFPLGKVVDNLKARLKQGKEQDVNSASYLTLKKIYNDYKVEPEINNKTKENNDTQKSVDKILSKRHVSNNFFIKTKTFSFNNEMIENIIDKYIHINNINSDIITINIIKNDIKNILYPLYISNPHNVIKGLFENLEKFKVDHNKKENILFEISSEASSDLTEAHQVGTGPVGDLFDDTERNGLKEKETVKEMLIEYKKLYSHKYEDSKYDDVLKIFYNSAKNNDNNELFIPHLVLASYNEIIDRLKDAAKAHTESRFKLASRNYSKQVFEKFRNPNFSKK